MALVGGWGYKGASGSEVCSFYAVIGCHAGRQRRVRLFGIFGPASFFCTKRSTADGFTPEVEVCCPSHVLQKLLVLIQFRPQVVARPSSSCLTAVLGASSQRTRIFASYERTKGLHTSGNKGLRTSESCSYVARTNQSGRTQTGKEGNTMWHNRKASHSPTNPQGTARTALVSPLESIFDAPTFLGRKVGPHGDHVFLRDARRMEEVLPGLVVAGWRIDQEGSTMNRVVIFEGWVEST